MAATESHLVPSQGDLVTNDKWKARYNLRLAIGYRDRRAGPRLGLQPEVIGARSSATALSFDVVNE
jgi:hypothetical protein